MVNNSFYLFLDTQTSLHELHRTSTVVKSGIFSARKNLESSFHHYGGPVDLLHASLSVRKGIENCFHDYGGSAKLMQACLSDGTLKAVFTTVEVL